MADFLLAQKPKFPEEVLDYSMDWSLRLLPAETISTHTATVVRGSATIVNEALPASTTQVFWVGGGVAGEDTLVKLKITTNSTPSRVHEILVRIRIATPS